MNGHALSPTRRRPAVFLDKDGTLVDDLPYNVDPALIRLTAGAGEALTSLHDAGFALVVISNQSGVARGHFPESALRSVVAEVRRLLADLGVPLLGFYYCPHHPDGVVAGYAIGCDCRKPRPGMVLQAAREHDLDLSRSWFVGDVLDDVEAGRGAGCRAVLIDNGNETEWVLTPERRPHQVAAGLQDAALRILGADRPGRAAAAGPQPRGGSS